MKNNYLINEIHNIKKEHPSVLISVVGAGGKTTTVFQLANQLKKDASILVTTTTAMFHPHDKVDYIYYKTLPIKHHNSNEVTALFDNYKESKDKVSGIEDQLVNQITQDKIFDYIINEADGARRRPLKCYAPHEPAIPETSHIVLVVIGADAIGKVLSENIVHRIDQFCEVAKIKIGDIITTDALINLLTHKKGFLKGLPKNSSVYVLINKSLSHPVDFDKVMFSNKIFSITNRYQAIIFSEMMTFELDAVFENNYNDSR
ncbi:MAG: putative selenium-dependent hydroxylase accessory protein YqeC [Clostridiales bacterium]|nr:putative selenium-dependent hydroxylase accessory protein YqeC [Clostridiales bacterium]